MTADSLASFLAYAKTLPNLTAAEERSLSTAARGGDKAAADKLVEHNIRLAVKMARDWVGSGLSFEDLIQEALVGLTKAVGRFDPDKGRLTTFATRWIYKSLWDSAYGSSTIKKPSRLSRTASATWDYVSHNAHASLEEIARAVKRPVEEVREVLDHGRVVSSIDNDDFVEVGTREVDDVVRVLDTLEPEEREAVSWRYGLYGRECSLEEVARRMSSDATLPGHYSQRDAARLCRTAVKRLRAARRDLDEVICGPHRSPAQPRIEEPERAAA